MNRLSIFVRSTTVAAALLGSGSANVSAAEIQRIWLSHQTLTPTHLVVNWESDTAGESIVEYGSTDALGQRAETVGKTTLHHVEIPLSEGGQPFFYRVRTGGDASAIHHVAGYPSDELRIAVVADTGYTKAAWADAVLAQKPHLLLSAGDHVPALHTGQPVPRERTAAFSQLIARWPALFRSTPWLAALGNHDREIRPRGPQPPPESVYDVEATAFRAFFALPEPEWHWHFDLPAFGLRIAALDLNHLSDQGTTWQTCHSPRKDGEQYAWYSHLLTDSEQTPFLITIYNEKNSTVRALEKGAWGRRIQQGTLAITGFGYFAERAEVEGFSYYNTSVNGTGSKYPDPKSQILKSEDNFVLLTLRREPRVLRAELRNLQGEVLEAKEFTPRPGTKP